METSDYIVSVTDEIVGKMGFSAKVTWVEGKQNQPATVAISSDDRQGMLIGKEGTSLASLEHVVRLVAGKRIKRESENSDSLPGFVIDVNNYRSSQSESLLVQARELAKKVSETRRAQTLPPMNAYQRRLVHTELATFGTVATESSGEDPNRRVVIKPAAEI